MQSMIGSLVKSFAMNPQMASLAMGAVSKMFLQKSNPKRPQNFYRHFLTI